MRRQSVRHEWVSWYILQDVELQKWIKSVFDEATREIDWHILLWSITGHHPAFQREIPSSSPNDSCDEMKLLFGHKDFETALQLLAEQLGQAKCPVHLASVSISAERDIYQRIRTSLADVTLSWDDWNSDQEIVGILAAVKNTLVAADVAGLALPTSSLGAGTHCEWQRLLSDSLSVAPKAAELSQLIDDRLTFKGVKQPLRAFQMAVASHASEVTLVRAGCGSGKTLAAYHWARERCEGKRLYICYPTTGTATEGFRDYLFDKTEHQPKSGAELFHGRSEIDCWIILETLDEETDAEFVALDRIRSPKGVEHYPCCATVATGCTVFFR